MTAWDHPMHHPTELDFLLADHPVWCRLDFKLALGHDHVVRYHALFRCNFFSAGCC
jgi:hypothetical protein